MRMFLHSAALGAAALALTLATSDTSRAGQAAPSNTAAIEISVSPDAKLWFDDSPTTPTGSKRSFVSPPLTPGQTYSYVITAQWRGPDGKDVVQKQRVNVYANAISRVDFVPRAQTTYYSSGYSTPQPAYYYTPQPGYYYTPQPGYYSGFRGGYSSGYYGGGRGLFSGYYRVGNVIINGRRWEISATVTATPT